MKMKNNKFKKVRKKIVRVIISVTQLNLKILTLIMF